MHNVHLKNISPGELGEVTLLVGDPKRIGLVIQLWENVTLLTENREFRLYNGTCHGQTVSICSTGMGVGSTEIAVIELIQSGAKAFVRLGGCGAWSETVQPGDLILNIGMARDPGMLNAYVADGYPAVANLQLLNQIFQTGTKQGFSLHLGIGLTTQSYYLGQSRKVMMKGLQATSKLIDYWQQRNILNCDMESAVIYLLASLYQIPAANCLVVHVNRKNEQWVPDEQYGKIHQSAARMVLDACLK